MKVGQSFHSSGFTANYVEVGGPDSVSNVYVVLSVLIRPLMMDFACLLDHNRVS